MKDVDATLRSVPQMRGTAVGMKGAGLDFTPNHPGPTSHDCRAAPGRKAGVKPPLDRIGMKVSKNAGVALRGGKEAIV